MAGDNNPLCILILAENPMIARETLLPELFIQTAGIVSIGKLSKLIRQLETS